MVKKFMQPLAQFQRTDLSNIKVVFADIDDTLTLNGRLHGNAYQAMENIRQAGILMIPVTGRPAGWCDLIARMWPVDGVVGENGAFYFRHDEAMRKLIKRFQMETNVRAANRVLYQDIGRDILTQITGTALASDQLYREADLAIDFCEDVPALNDDAIDGIVGIMESRGLTAKVSSIHVNGWFGDYDKLTMTKLMMSECFDMDLDAEKQHMVFVGDSPNDQPMFGYFPHSVGVANLKQFENRLDLKPAYLTPSPGGDGFVELAEALLRA